MTPKIVNRLRWDNKVSLNSFVNISNRL